jgi:dodecin
MAEQAGAIVKILELVGSSEKSFSDAVRNAVKTASETVRGIQGVEVIGSNATVDNGELTNYKVHCKIAFLIEK